MNPTELAPLVSSAPAQVANFNWSSVLPLATTALLALIGVVITQLVNSALKKEEFKRQEAAVARQRIYESANNLIKSVESVNSFYIEYATKYLSLLVPAHNLATAIISPYNHMLHVISPLQTKLNSQADKMKVMIESEEFDSFSTQVRNIVTKELNHHVVWFNDASLVKSYKEYTITSSKQFTGILQLMLTIDTMVIRISTKDMTADLDSSI